MPNASTSAPTPAPTTVSATPATSQPASQQDGAEDASASLRKLSQQAGDGSSSTPTKQPQTSQVHKTRSWYGSWPRVPKSSASTSVAKETIQGGTSKPRKTADFSKYETRKTSDTASLDGANESSAALPNIAENGSDHHGADGNKGAPAAAAQHDNAADKQADVSKPSEGNGTVKTKDDVKDAMPTEAGAPKSTPPDAETPQRPTTSSGWLGWLGRSTAGVPAEAPSAPVNPETAALPKEMEVDEAPTQSPPEAAEAPAATGLPSNDSAPGHHASASRSSWFGLWSSSATETTDATKSLPEVAAQPAKPAEAAKEPEDVVMKDAPAVEDATNEPPKQSAPKAGSTWAFWSTDTGSKSNGKQVAREEGQLAVMGESSENKPRRSKSMDINTPRPKEEPLKSPERDDASMKLGTSPAKGSISSKKSKRLRPHSMDLEDVSSPSRPSTPKTDTAPKAAESTPKAGASKATTTTTTTTSTKSTSQNLLLPSFRSTYRLKENPSILQQIAQVLLRSQQPPANHVFLVKEPPKIKKALAIGVHGLFPANYMRTIIGQPTGTSIKFANHGAEAIRRWADSHGCKDCEIEKVALEGEGKIGERVENLWKLLLNWIDQIRGADLIIIACHSQGVPVSLMLLAKLIELGVVTNARVGVCAMAGVSLGPFLDYRSGMGILMGSAAELWEFSNSESEISKRLEASVKTVLNHGARVTLVGSLDDQVVPLESAIYSPAHHPYIYRSVFIDGRIHAPDFIAHLVGFALKLRNLGVTDHGLIRELSQPLAGSLYSGEGHSRLYDDEQVYDLAVSHALETTDLTNAPPCEIHKYEGLTQPNPYHLPWIMRGLLEEDFVKTELNSETAELLRQFDDWKPTTKALKDVKYRLEVVRSKL
ncbi:hypothetical protein CONLIGDRAFT_652236 [Coniochaeta ligniaria NRRL 30616]|uniref:YMC020W-like alpha/beta hydrolase domain-containing protein n=1 Tax=Coniochaeta ligniaria NRRL 30616 TaxID=1408157 RepID=A0A1J7J1Z9_9PEZI|nr:hypothetical protein CONLIGDRAFT_652236 [Coniochaeta ligniaria NRRL 30616]